MAGLCCFSFAAIMARFEKDKGSPGGGAAFICINIANLIREKSMVLFHVSVLKTVIL
jgi:hypothetical protein